MNSITPAWIALLLLLFAAPVIAWFAESYHRRNGEKPVNERRRIPRLIFVLGVMVFGAFGSDKPIGPTIVRAAMQRLTVNMSTGSLIGPFAHFVASGIEAQAQTQIAEDKWQIVAAAENVIGLAGGTISNLTVAAETDVPVMFVAPDIDTSATTSNIVIRPIRMCERIDPVTGSHTLRRWYYMADLPSAAPTIDSYASASAEEWTKLTAITNSFPATETLDADGDALACVWYDFILPVGFYGVVIRPPEFVELGGKDEPFEAAGMADADLNWVGATGEFEIDAVPGIIFQGEGGVTVGFRVKPGYETKWTEAGGVWTYQE